MTGRAVLVSKVVRMKERRVTVRVKCPTRPRGFCNGTVKIRTTTKFRGRRITLGTKAFQGPSGAKRKTSITVTERVARKFRGRTVRAKVYIVSRDGNGTAAASVFNLKIKG